jgi:hypothetical protein
LQARAVAPQTRMQKRLAPRWAERDPPVSSARFTAGCAGQAPVGVWRCLCRHGLSNEVRRLAPVVGYAARYELPQQGQERERRHRCAAGRAGSSGVENAMMKRVVERVGLR